MRVKWMGWIVCCIMALAALSATPAFASQLQEEAMLSLSQEGKSVSLSWTPVSGVTRYAVFRASKPTGNFKRITYTKNCTFTQQSNGKAFFYRVYPMTGNKRGPSSNVVGTLPGAKGLSIRQSQEGFHLQWQRVNFATAYQVETAQSPSGPWQALGLPTQQTSMDIPDDGGSTRYFRVLSLYGGS